MNRSTKTNPKEGTRKPMNGAKGRGEGEGNQWEDAEKEKEEVEEEEREREKKWKEGNSLIMLPLVPHR